jgi:hypothetical protein
MIGTLVHDEVTMVSTQRRSGSGPAAGGAVEVCYAFARKKPRMRSYHREGPKGGVAAGITIVKERLPFQGRDEESRS